MNIIKKSLNEIDVNDSFFDSLRNDYPNFNNWFLRKRNSDYFAYVTEDENGNLGSFLLLKEERYQDILSITGDYCLKNIKNLDKILKISTFKIVNTGKGIGSKYLKIAYDRAREVNASIIYTTVYPKYKIFIKFLEKNGFRIFSKINNDSSDEFILIKNVVNDDLKIN